MKKRLNLVFRNTTFLLFFGFSTYAQIDSLKIKIENSTKDEKVIIYKGLVEKYKETEIDKALEYAHKGLALIKDEDIRDVGYFCSSLSTLYSKSSKLKKALSYSKKALSIAKRIEYQLGEALSYQNIGGINDGMGNYQEALTNNLKALAIFESIEDKNWSFCVIINLGNLYSKHFNDYIEAKTYYDRALKLSQDYCDQKNEAKALIKISQLYIEQNIFSKAKEKLIVADSILTSEKENYPLITNSILSSLSTICIKEGNYEEALNYSKESLKIRLESGISNDNAYEYLRFADIYDKMDNKKSASSYFEKAEKKALTNNEMHELFHVYQLQHQYHIKNKNFKKGYDYLLKYTTIKDSLFNAKKNKQMSELLVKHEAKKKKQEIFILNKEKELQSEVLKNTQIELSRKTRIYYEIIVLTIILLITFSMLLYFYRQKLKNKELLRSKNEEINKQKTLKLIRDQEIQNVKTNLIWQEKEKERISGELHDGVAPSIAAVKFGLLKISESLNNEAKLKKLIQIVDNAYEEIRSISHNFSSLRVNNTSFIDLLEDYLNEIGNINSIKVDFRCNAKEKMNQISDEIKVDIYRIIQESMNNILKHSKSNRAEIQLTWNKNHLNLIVEDKGVGFDPNKKSFGIGLNSIKSRVNILQGVIDIDSFIDRGTIINIDIPVGVG